MSFVRYGKCQRCEVLGKVETVGTLDGATGTPVVLQLCSQCSTLYLHLNRAQRRQVGQAQRQKPKVAKKKPDNATLQRIRQKAQAKKPSPIVLPTTEPKAPEKPKSPIIIPGQDRRSKEGIILP